MKTKLFIIALMAVALMACSSKDEPKQGNMPYVEGQKITMKCTMATPNDGSDRVARRITGTHAVLADNIPFAWQFDPMDIITIKAVKSGNTSELIMQSDPGSSTTAAFEGMMPDGWQPGDEFFAICGPKEDDAEPAKSVTKAEGLETTIERGEMRFVSDTMTEIPNELVLRAAWSAMSMYIVIATDNTQEPVIKNVAYLLNSIDIKTADESTVLYHYEYENCYVSGKISSSTAQPFLPLLVVKNGSYDNFVFTADFTLMQEIYDDLDEEWRDWPCKFVGIGDKGHITFAGEYPQEQHMIVKFQYPETLTLKPNQFLAADPASVNPKVVKVK